MPEIHLPYPHPGQIAVRQQAKRFNWLSAGRRWRKTTMAMAIAVESAANKKKIIWGAPTFDQVRIGFRETQTAASTVAEFNQTRMEAVFPGGGAIFYRSLDDPNNVRGYTADGVVMDECSYINKKAYREVLRPMLIDTGGWSWGICTANGRNWYWEEHQKAHDDPDSMAWVVPTLGVRITNKGLTRDPHPLENPNIPFVEIERLFSTMAELVFRQEILAEFVDFAGGVFRRVQEAARLTPLDAPLPGRQYIAGVDVAAAVDYTVISILDASSREMVYMDRYNRVDYNVLIDRIAAIHERWNCQAVKVEANSIGQPVIDALYSRSVPVIPFTTTNATKQVIIQNLQAAFERGEIGIINDPVLIGELLSFEGKRSQSGAFTYSAPDGMHDDTVMSLAIAWDGVANIPWAVY